MGEVDKVGSNRVSREENKMEPNFSGFIFKRITDS